MAKIKARGDREQTRWRRDADGAELVHTLQGRLLSKPARGHSFTLLGKRTSSEARHAAVVRGMTQV